MNNVVEILIVEDNPSELELTLYALQKHNLGVTAQPGRGLARKKGVRGGVHPHAHLFFGELSFFA